MRIETAMRYRRGTKVEGLEGRTRRIEVIGRLVGDGLVEARIRITIKPKVVGERHSGSDGDEPRKKRAKVPTWSDAIEGLIDANIDLRQSRPSNGGRGRKRRR